MAVVLHGHVVGLGLKRDRLVGRHGPGRGGPDHEIHRTVEGLEAGRLARELEAHVDGRARLVAVLDLGLGKSGVAVLAPVHWLAATVHHALVVHLLEDLDVGGVVLVVEGEVGVIPVTEHAQTAEAGLLELDVLDRELVAHLANLGRRHLIELGGAHLLLDLVLDGLAVAIPAGHVRHVAALHHPIAVDDVLGDLVHGVAHVDGAVGVRGAVVQDELVVALILLARQLVDVVLAPGLEALRLPRGEASPHGEARLGEVHRLLVLVSHWLRAAPFASLRPHPRAERLRAERPRTKKAPVPTAGTKRLEAAVRDTAAATSFNHPASGDPPYSAGLSRRPLRWLLLGARLRAPPACAGLFGPRLRGDVRLGAAAGSHHSRSLETAVTGLLVPITAFVGHGSTPGDAGPQRNSLETKTAAITSRGCNLGPGSDTSRPLNRGSHSKSRTIPK